MAISAEQAVRVGSEQGERPGARSASAPVSRRPGAAAFNLIRWFSILSFASIALVSVLSSVFLSRFLTSQMLQRDAEVTMEIIQSVCESEKAPEFFLNPHPVMENDTDLSEFFHHIGNLPDVLRANIYSRDRVLLWSTEARLVGQRFDRNDDLDEALAGKISLETGVTGREQNPKQEHKFLDDTPVNFVETYMPLRDPATREVIGVVELYRIPRALFATIATGTRWVWAFAVLGGLFLYAALFWVVYRGDRIIHTQQSRLVETETMAVLGEMASAVAHGIRNPLASIRSSAELSQCEGEAAVTGCAQDIINEVDRLEHWVRDLLTYSQPDREEVGSVDLVVVVHKSVEAFARETSRRGIEVAVELPPALPRIQGSEALLGQVLNSLLANAMDAMPQAGRLRVRAEVEERARRVLLTVEDTGMGIPAHELGKVFVPFHTTKARGLGVGLALARRIITRFGGDIAIQSREGRGTTVSLHLLAAR